MPTLARLRGPEHMSPALRASLDDPDPHGRPRAKKIVPLLQRAVGKPKANAASRA